MKSLNEIVKNLRSNNEMVHREILATGKWMTVDQIDACQKLSVGDADLGVHVWKARKQIFSVTFEGNEYFAGYQFDPDLQPLPIIRDILEVFGTRYQPWTVAAWFYFPNGWIVGVGDRQREPIAPMSALDRPDDVIRAAQFMHGGYVV
jgi:hypothetical protein